LLGDVADFLTEVGGIVGGGAALGGTAGFVGWLLRGPIRWYTARRRGEDPDEAELDRLGMFVTVGAGIGGVGGFLLWLYEHQGLI
jgi:hypothetical protein